MEIDVNNARGGPRRRHGQSRLLEKQIRPEIFERCLQFIDLVINQIVYQENIYPSRLLKFKTKTKLILYFFKIYLFLVKCIRHLYINVLIKIYHHT